MASENFANFATANLTSPTTLAALGSAKTFSVTSGLGTLFPLSNFIVCIDTELMLIASRSADNFTVANKGRGYDGTTIATHTAGSNTVVQLPICRYNMVHLWNNIADTYNPLVPPVQLGNTPSSYDNEFEATGSWILSPAAGAGTTFSVNSAMFSHLVFNRGLNDNTIYTAYVPFTPAAGAFTISAKVSSATGINHSQTQDQTQLHLFVADQGNPSGNTDSGTRFRVDICDSSNIGSNNVTTSPMRYARAATDSASVFKTIGNTPPLATNSPVWIRITYDGNGTWQAYYGDGYTYWTIGGVTNFSFSPATLGISFSPFIPSGSWIGQTAVIDYVRVVPGSILPLYGS